MHPIRSAIRILLIPVTARIFLQGGLSLLSQMTIIPVVTRMNTNVEINILRKVTLSSFLGT